jgi:hypothetical protein
MRDVESFKNDDILTSFLAQQLDQGALAIVLGAGISIPLGLPSWPDLLQKLADKLTKALATGLGPDEQAEALFHASGLTALEFAEQVRALLYQGVDRSFSGLLNSHLLAALGALAMPSRRGSASEIITFNFDDLLETYLGYYGFTVEVVDILPAWNSRADIRVFHPHGLLPSNPEAPLKRGIVLTRSDYDKTVGDPSSAWHSALTQTLASHTCIFLGLSGADANLTSLLTRVQGIHPAAAQGQPYWGIRLTTDGVDPRKSAWESRGVFQKTLSSYDQMPHWLTSICQKAARAYRIA